MWHRVFPRFCGWFYFSAFAVRGAGRVPASGPVLWLGLHRNGAVDGFVYSAALCRPAEYLISTQLRKNFLARVFFNGIAVVRPGDEGDRGANRAALGECLALLRQGGELFVFPEGTSALGPRHLPFKAGAVQLVLDWLEGGGGALRVMPVGIHYDCAGAFRSRVEVTVGEPIDLALPANLAPLARLRELKHRMTAALEAAGANFADAVAQQEAEALANIAALASGRSRFAVLKACERGGMEAALAAWRELDAAAHGCRAARYHGVPLLPAGTGVRESLELLALGPLVLAGLLLNAPPWLAGAWAAKKFPDGPNVISLWKILVGLPAFAVWSVAVGLVAAFGGAGWWIFGYAALTFLAWAAYDRMKRHGVAVWNGCFHAALRDPFAGMIAHCLRPDEPTV